MAVDAAAPPLARPGRVRRTLGWYRRGWWWKLPATGLAVAIIAVSLGLLIFHLYLNHRLDTEMDRIRAEGYPARWNEIDAWIGPMPRPERDATPLYEAAFAALATEEELEAVGLPRLREVFDYYDEQEKASVQELAQARQLVELDAEALRLVREANTAVRAGHEVRFDRAWGDGSYLMMPELLPLREAARLLQAEAELAAARGDADAVALAISEMLDLPAASEHDPTLISQLVRISIHMMAIQTLERLHHRVDFTPEHLRSLQAAFEATSDPDAMMRALVVERALGSWAYDGLASGDVTVGEVAETGTGNPPWPARPLWRLTGLRKLDQLAFLDVMREWIRVAEREGVDVAPPSPEGNNVPTVYLVAKLLTPALGAVIRSKDRELAALAVVQVACALERHRLAHGRLPATLDGLVPTYLKAVPNDPLAPGRLRYRVSEDAQAAVVYSIGPDGTDDGGRERRPGGRRYADGTDITFSLGDAQRRFFPGGSTPR